MKLATLANGTRDGRLVVTNTVEQLRADAPRIMSVRLSARTDPARFRVVDGVVAATGREDWIDLRLDGDLRPALQLALEIGLDDLTARHADLDELFLGYYQDDEAR